jgi:hypothetical protein
LTVDESQAGDASAREPSLANPEWPLPTLARAFVAALIAFGTTASAASAGSSPIAADAAQLTFGNRTENRDGSVAMTVGRRLPTEWDTKFGADFSLAKPAGVTPAENLLTRQAPERSTGAVWGSIAAPGVPPLGFDKTSISARVDPAKEEGKFGAVLSRSCRSPGACR